VFSGTSGYKQGAPDRVTNVSNYARGQPKSQANGIMPLLDKETREPNMSENTPANQIDKSVLFRLAPVLLLNLTAFAVAIPILPALTEAMGGEGFEVGALFAVQATGQLMMAPLWGKLSDRIGRKPILLVTILGALLADVWTSFTDTLFLLFAARFVAGLFAGNIATASALIADATDLKSRSKGMAIVGICFGLGFTLGPGIGAAASYFAPDELGPLGRGLPFLIAAGINALVVILAGLFLKEASSSEEARRQARESRKVDSIASLLARRAIAIMSGFFLTYSITVTILETTFYLYMAKTYSYDESQVGMFFAGMGLLAATVQGGIGRISSRIGDGRMTFVGVVLLSLGLILATLYETLWFLIIFLAVAAIGRALLQPGGMAIMSSLAADDQETGKVMGLMQSAQSLGRILGPVIGGLLYDHLAPRAPFIAAGCLLASVGVWWWFAFGKSRSAGSDLPSST
jgi:DHA1 family tetracycline resistance protein-like MFS transporter